MNAGTTGTQSQPTNDKNHPQVHGNHTHSARAEAAHEELTPDRPPHPVETGEATGHAEPRTKRPRGFAAMDRALVSEIARKGGKAAHSAGTAHEFTSEEARVAGRKGGRATHAKRRKPDEAAGSEPQADGDKPAD